MSASQAASDAPPGRPRRPGAVEVRRAEWADVTAALSGGWRDFLAEPVKAGFFGLVYAAAGILIVLFAATLDLGWAVYPAMLGFALIGPFAAVGLYEISRRLERGERPGWGDVLGVIWAQRKTEIAWMGFVMLFVNVVWMYQVRLLLALFLGMAAFGTFEQLITVLFSTEEGLWFLLFGHVIGAVLAIAVFSITVLSIPMLLDRQIDIVTAIVTSVKGVVLSPAVMVCWGVFVVLSLIVAALPGFLGLIVVLPVLGCATWRLYRRLVSAAG